MAGAVASSNRQYRPALELKRIPELLQRIDSYTGRPLTRLSVELRKVRISGEILLG